jgi:hypothetical protein
VDDGVVPELHEPDAAGLTGWLPFVHGSSSEAGANYGLAGACVFVPCGSGWRTGQDASLHAIAGVATDDRLEPLQNREWAELRGGERMRGP